MDDFVSYYQKVLPKDEELIRFQINGKDKELKLNRYQVSLELIGKKKVEVRNVFEYTSGMRISHLVLREKNFFVCAVNEENIYFSDRIFSNIQGDTNPKKESFILKDEYEAILLKIIHRMSLVPTKKYSDIYNEILHEDEVNFDLFITAFPYIYIMEIDDNQLNYQNEGKVDIEKTLLYLILNEDIEVPRLKLDEKMREDLKELFFVNQTSSYPYNYHNVLLGILSHQWTQIFMSLYKIIESTYPYFYYKSLFEKINKDSLSFRDIFTMSTFLEKEYRHRPEEKASFSKLIEEIDYNESSVLSEIVDKKQQRIEQSYYNLRNAIVHEREIFRENRGQLHHIAFTENNWIAIINEMIKIVRKALSDEEILKHCRNNEV